MFNVLIFAAGMGKRLSPDGWQIPKCLIELDGKSLLRRHLEILGPLAPTRIVIAVGYEHQLIETELVAIGSPLAIETVYNPEYKHGSILTLRRLLDYLNDTTTVILMDADVLYDHRMVKRLLTSDHKNCLLLDRNFESGDEPVKLCISNGRIVEFRKKVDTTYDWRGESVGFFHFTERAVKWLDTATQCYIDQKKRNEPYEEAIRDILLANSDSFGFEDITGLPWIEIDFPEDLERARNVILPRLVGTNNSLTH